MTRILVESLKRLYDAGKISEAFVYSAEERGTIEPVESDYIMQSDIERVKYEARRGNTDER